MAYEALKRFLATKLPRYEDPRSIGKALKGQKYGEYWRYEVGGFRVIAKIEDQKLLILVVKIGVRKKRVQEEKEHAIPKSLGSTWPRSKDRGNSPMSSFFS